MDVLSSYYNTEIGILEHMKRLASDDPDDVQAAILQVNEERHLIKKKLDKLKEEVIMMRKMMRKAHKCCLTMKALSEVNSRARENVPQQALKISKSPEVCNLKIVEEASRAKNNPPPPKACVVKNISFLTLDEFNKIPKYMKGRLSYELLTQAVKEFNDCVNMKYDFLAKDVNELTLNEKKKRAQLKSQMKPELKKSNFVTADDLKEYTMFKTDSSRKSVFTVLRHFQRIKENRGPGSIVRHVVV